MQRIKPYNSYSIELKPTGENSSPWHELIDTIHHWVKGNMIACNIGLPTEFSGGWFENGSDWPLPEGYSLKTAREVDTEPHLWALRMETTPITKIRKWITEIAIIKNGDVFNFYSRTGYSGETYIPIPTIPRQLNDLISSNMWICGKINEGWIGGKDNLVKIEKILNGLRA